MKAPPTVGEFSSVLDPRDIVAQTCVAPFRCGKHPPKNVEPIDIDGV